MARFAWAGLIVVLIFDVWLRAHTFEPTLRADLGLRLWPSARGATEPLDCDEAAYAYMGRRLLRGDVLYRDVSENKPPLGYWIYTLAVAAGGTRELPIRLLPIPFALATIAAVWSIARRVAGGGAACVAACVCAVMTTDPFVFGNGSNLEHMMNAFGTIALAFYVASESATRRRVLLLALAGVFLGLAALVKQVVFPFGFVVAVAILTRPGASLKVRARDLACWSGAGLAVCLAAALILVAQGAGSWAFDDIFVYGRAIATDVPADPQAPSRWIRWLTGNADPQGRLPWPFGRTDYLVWWGAGAWPLWLASAASMFVLAVAPRGDGRRPRLLIVAWTLAAWAQVVLPGQYWQHYYMLPIPGTAIVVAVALGDGLRGWRASLKSRAVAGILGAAALCGALCAAIVATVAIQGDEYLRQPPEQLAIRDKGGGQWLALRDLGRTINRATRGWHDPRLFVWGWQSPLHTYGALDGVTREFFTNALLKTYADTDHALVKPRTERIMRDLQRHPPEFIFCGYPPFRELSTFLDERYVPSTLTPLNPSKLGLWVEKTRYGAFENDLHSRMRE